MPKQSTETGKGQSVEAKSVESKSVESKSVEGQLVEGQPVSSGSHGEMADAIDTENRKGFRTFLFLLVGQLVSLFGSQITGFALSVWVFQETQVVMDLSLIILTATVPLAICAPIAGALVDRYNRKIVLLIGQTGAALCTLTMALLLWNDALSYPRILTLLLISGVFNSVMLPGFYAITTALVSKKQLPRANGIRDFGSAAVFLLMPVVAPLLLKAFGMKGVLFFDVATFLVGLTALLLARIPDARDASMLKAAKRESSSIFDAFKWSHIRLYFRDVNDAWRYLKKRNGLLLFLFFYAVFSFFMNMVLMLIVPFVLTIADEVALSQVLFVAGVGAVSGGAIALVVGVPKHHALMVLLTALVFSLVFVVVPMSASVMTLSIGAFFIGLCAPVNTMCYSTLWQTKVMKSMQGRVAGLRLILMRSVMPIATIASGFLADKVFTPLMKSEHTLVLWLRPWFGESEGLAVMGLLLGVICTVLMCIGFLIPSLRRLDLLKDEE